MAAPLPEVSKAPVAESDEVAREHRFGECVGIEETTVEHLAIVDDWIVVGTAQVHRGLNPIGTIWTLVARDVDTEQTGELYGDTDLLHHFSARSILWVFSKVLKPARDTPVPIPRFMATPGKQDLAITFDEHICRGALLHKLPERTMVRAGRYAIGLWRCEATVIAMHGRTITVSANVSWTSTLKAVTGSSFGDRFRISTFGESHGGGVGVVIDGCPPRLALDIERVQFDLDRRRPGQSKLVTQRKEADSIEVLSGTFEGLTLGTSLAMLVRNTDARPNAYDHMRNVYRPSHADYTTEAKYGTRNWQGGGRASARETIGRVAAGAVARQLLEQVAGVEVLAWVSSVGAINAEVDQDTVTLDAVEADPTRCPDPSAAATMTAAIEQARRDGDSLGGVVTCVARRVPAGLGEPVFDKLDAELAKAMISLPAAKGFEIGSGFAGTLMTGLAHNDPFEPGPDGTPVTTQNHSGGVQGGISNGADIVMRVAFKPTGTISSAQQTVDRDNNAVTLEARGRHDPCVLPRAVPMVEAMTLLVLADHWLRQQATDVL